MPPARRSTKSASDRAREFEELKAALEASEASLDVARPEVIEDLYEAPEVDRWLLPKRDLRLDGSLVKCGLRKGGFADHSQQRRPEFGDLAKLLRAPTLEELDAKIQAAKKKKKQGEEEELVVFAADDDEGLSDGVVTMLRGEVASFDDQRRKVRYFVRLADFEPRVAAEGLLERFALPLEHAGLVGVASQSAAWKLVWRHGQPPWITPGEDGCDLYFLASKQRSVERPWKREKPDNTTVVQGDEDDEDYVDPFGEEEADGAVGPLCEQPTNWSTLKSKVSLAGEEDDDFAKKIVRFALRSMGRGERATVFWRKGPVGSCLDLELQDWTLTEAVDGGLKRTLRAGPRVSRQPRCLDTVRARVVCLNNSVPLFGASAADVEHLLKAFKRLEFHSPVGHEGSASWRLDDAGGALLPELSQAQSDAVEATILTMRPTEIARVDTEHDRLVVELLSAVEAPLATPLELKELGNAAFGRGEHDRAVRRYQETVKRLLSCEQRDDELIAVVYSNMAECHLELGDFGLAVRCASSAVSYAPSNAKAHRRLARGHMRLGDLELARAPLRAALKLEPTSHRARADLADLKSLFKARQLKERAKYSAAFPPSKNPPSKSTTLPVPPAPSSSSSGDQPFLDWDDFWE